MRAVDLFCGCGGFTVGLKECDIDVILAVDNNAVAVQVYRENHEHEVMLHDLQDVQPVIARIRQMGGVDIVAGSSPCQDFSACGKGKETDAVSGLTVRFAEVVVALMPSAFLLENVPNIIHSKSFKRLSDLVTAAGYDFTVVTLNSKYAGTCQCRRRSFVCGALGPHATELRALQHTIKHRQASAKAGAPVTIKQVLGEERCGNSVYFAARNKFHPCVISTDRVYPTLRSHRGKCVERPARAYRPRYEDVSTIDAAHVLEPCDAALIASFPRSYTWNCSRERAGVLIGNSVPPAMVREIVSNMRMTGALGLHTASQHVGHEVPSFYRVRKQIPSHIEMFWGGKTPLNVGEVVNDGPPRVFSYEMGTSEIGDDRMYDVLGYRPLPQWTVQFKERLTQKNRVDDTYVYVPGYPTPFRGRRQLETMGLLHP